MNAAAASAAFDTERLRVRSLCAADEALYCSLYTDARLMRHIGPPLDAQQVRRSFHAAVSAAARQPPRHVYFSLHDRQQDRALGVCAVRDIDLEHKRAEIGLMLRREAHASGIAREGLQAVIAWSFRELPIDQLYGQTDSANLAACRAARRAGFSAQAGGDTGGAAASSCMFLFNRPVSRHRSSTSQSEE